MEWPVPEATEGKAGDNDGQCQEKAGFGGGRVRFGTLSRKTNKLIVLVVI